MFDNIKWLFFDVGSNLVDETIAYEHRMKDMAKSVDVSYEAVYEKAMQIYKQNGKEQGFGRYWNITGENEMADCVVNNLTNYCLFYKEKH